MPLVVATMSSKSSSARLADIGGRKLETVGEHVGPPRERAITIVPLRGRQALIQRDNPLFGRATLRRKPGLRPLDLGLHHADDLRRVGGWGYWAPLPFGHRYDRSHELLVARLARTGVVLESH